MQDLSLLPHDNLGEVHDYIASLLMKSKPTVKSNRRLKGIWKNPRFDKIVDVQTEINEVRKWYRNLELKTI